MLGKRVWCVANPSVQRWMGNRQRSADFCVNCVTEASMVTSLNITFNGHDLNWFSLLIYNQPQSSTGYLPHINKVTGCCSEAPV